MTKDRHYLRFRYSPFEIRKYATLDEDVNFGGTVFPQGQDVASAYFLGDLRARYAYELVPDSRFDVQVGAGVIYIDTTISLAEVDADGEVDRATGLKVVARDFRTLLYARLGVRFSRLVDLYFDIDASTEDLVDGAVKLGFDLNPKWTVAVGYRQTSQTLDTDKVWNEFEREGGLVHVAYSF